MYLPTFWKLNQEYRFWTYKRTVGFVVPAGFFRKKFNNFRY